METKTTASAQQIISAEGYIALVGTRLTLIMCKAIKTKMICIMLSVVHTLHFMV